MKRITSISLGSSKRDKATKTSFLGEDFEIERIGTNGNLLTFRQKLTELDGKVDAFGLGGTDMYIYAAGRRYTFGEIQRLASAAVKTPVVDGSGLKNTLERETVNYLQREGIVDFKKSRVLLVCGVDRFGMAEALDATGASVTYGDLMFSLDIPIAIRSLNNLKGKVILTNTTTADDVEELKKRGVKLLVTTTPEFDGRSFGTNVMEGVLIAMSGRKPEELTPSDYMVMLGKLGWKPRIQVLNGVAAPSVPL
jgi:hypothetical protein